jgi:bifunctional non-homologous end joining protein LigD
MARNESVVEIQGRSLKLGNLDKVMYPETGFTKAQVIDYYVRIAPALLPHLHDRPLTMKRYPNGVTGMFFYEKNCPKHRPDWVQTAKIWSGGNNRFMYYCMIQDLPTLVWAANLADIELHTSLSLCHDIIRPTMIVFDLDPGPPANIVQCCEVGLWVRDLFGHFGLQAFPKTSGSKGLQIYIPLHTDVSYNETKPFAKAIARLMEREHPQKVVSDMKKALRVNKIFVDWSQNDDYKTTVCVYSLRAKEAPTASTPVTWDEVANCLKKGDPNLLRFECNKVLDRFEKQGDLFAPVVKLKQTLPSIERLEEAAHVVQGSGATKTSVAVAREASTTARAAARAAARSGAHKASSGSRTAGKTRTSAAKASKPAATKATKKSAKRATTRKMG